MRPRPASRMAEAAVVCPARGARSEVVEAGAAVVVGETAAGTGPEAARAMLAGAATATVTIAAGQSVRIRMLGHVLSPRPRRARHPDALRESRSFATAVRRGSSPAAPSG